MSHTLRISQITFGGNGSDNPVPLTQANYDLSPAEQKMQFSSMNVIAPTDTGGTVQVTALIVINPNTGQPEVGPNDLCYAPCPPLC